MEHPDQRPAPAAISVRRLRKHYGPVRAVDGIDIDVPVGQVAALLGPNGAGKTTALDMLLGLLPPDEGAVELMGVAPRRALDAGDVGAMLQTGDLVRGAKVAELLRAFAALHSRPTALDTLVRRTGLSGLLDRRTEKLSGGETQRVRFALALMGDPKVLVLDEPTAGLDVSTRREFWTYVRDYAESGRTVLFSTHYLEEADDNADRIIVIAGGRIVADGPTTAIRAGVADRMVRCTLPGVSADEIKQLPGVSSVDVHGDALTIRSTDADATLHALLPAYPKTRDIEVAAAPLADAFLALTSPDTGVSAAEPDHFLELSDGVRRGAR